MDTSKQVPGGPTLRQFLKNPTVADYEIDIDRGIEQWALIKMREMKPSSFQEGNNGGADEYRYGMSDFIAMMREHCPEAVTAMLRAGADFYVG